MCQQVCEEAAVLLDPQTVQQAVELACGGEPSNVRQMIEQALEKLPDVVHAFEAQVERARAICDEFE